MLRRNIRRILRKYGYPPDKQEKAIQTVIEQAKLLAEELEYLSLSSDFPGLHLYRTEISLKR